MIALLTDKENVLLLRVRQVIEGNDGRSRIRTYDPLIKSHELSYGYQRSIFKLREHSSVTNRWVAGELQTGVVPLARTPVAY